MDKAVIEQLRNTIVEVEELTNAIEYINDVQPKQVLSSVLFEVEFDKFSDSAKARFKDLVDAYLVDVESILNDEIKIKLLSIKQLKV